MNTAYKVIPLQDQEYSYFIILCSDNSPYDYVNDILDDIKLEKPAKVIIDQILHVGNTDKRFLSFLCDKQKTVKDTEFVYLKKDSPFRKVTCDFLRDSGIIDNSILTSIQKRMIKKGIII